jgi:hypothetical protein
MAQVHIEKKSNVTMIAAAVMAAVAAAAGWWYFNSGDESAQAPAVATDASAASAPAEAGASAAPATEPVVAEVPLPAASVAAIQAEQEVANNEINKEVIPPFKGPIKRRPAFISSMEWDMLKGVADQQANPDEGLTRLINTTLFYKQLERWQALHSGADMATRQALAQRLLDDLPQRVTNDDMSIPDVQKLQVELLVDVEPDPKLRASRAQKEAKRLVPPPVK